MAKAHVSDAEQARRSAQSAGGRAGQTIPSFALRHPKSPRHPRAIWFRSIGGISLLLGAAGLMQSAAYFWWSVAFVYIGFAALILDLWLEPWFQLERVWLRAIELFLVCG